MDGSRITTQYEFLSYCLVFYSVCLKYCEAVSEM